ncbi:hypothetical protein CEXT_469631 [Caerostris extrusa]|uniref:Uncharacterized protein n=1 Tax=Caerostris extrusa TaxID=172846 RepID=A0AAV4VZE2_CAEEX|nr:hypothetical protein CEXT_469631 [Caerostris extrusa]
MSGEIIKFRWIPFHVDIDGAQFFGLYHSLTSVMADALQSLGRPQSNQGFFTYLFITFSRKKSRNYTQSRSKNKGKVEKELSKDRRCQAAEQNW